MRLTTTGLVWRLGIRRFVRFVAHLPGFVKLFSRLAKDPRVPLSPKLVLLAILVYALLPMDLLPDFFPGIGQLDDLMVIFLRLNLFLRLCPREIVPEHVQSIAAGH